MAQVAVITGAASGIGHACVRELRRREWRVIGWDLSPADDPDVEWHHVDVGEYGSVEQAAGRLEEVSLLVNAAGVSDRAAAHEMTPAQWDRVIRVDLSGVFHCCRALYPALASVKGTVINIASIAAHRSFAQRANYCAAKAGVLALTEVLGLEWAETGVRVVAISPGFVATPMMVAGIEAGFIDKDDVLRRTPQRRLATPEEIASAIVALAGEPFRYVTGTTLLIDGGWCANGGF